MIKKIKQWFKKKPVDPNYEDAFKMLQKINEDYENITFYMAQITDRKLNTEAIAYLVRAGFNLNSIRDEVQIVNNQNKDRKIHARIAK